MKKILAVLLALTLVFAFAACGDDPVKPDDTTDPVDDTTDPVDDTTDPVDDTTDPADDTDPALEVMTYDEYMAAEIDAEVLVEAYVQATQSWWDNKITVYAQDADGAYFIYEMACSEEDAAKLVPGAKIKVQGYKADFEGEIEIADATFEFVDGDAYIAEAIDLTDKLGTDELINYQNQLAAFKGLTVEAVEFKNGEAGDDIYVTLGLDGASYNFCVEVYLTGTDTEVYETVSNLKVGDMVNVEAFVYWYQGANPHITFIEAAK